MITTRIFLPLLLFFLSLGAFSQSFSDDFQVRRMDTQHFHLWDQDETIVNMGTRGMTIMAKGSTPQDANIIYFDATDKAWEAEANMILYPTSEGGLVLMNSRNEYWGITADYRNIYVRNSDGIIKTTRNPYGRYLRLRLSYNDDKLTLATASTAASKVVANANPGTKRTPAKSCNVLATLDVKSATRIAFTSAKKDVVSIRDFWYTAK